MVKLEAWWRFLIVGFLFGAFVGLPTPAWAPDPSARSAPAVPLCPFFSWGGKPVIESSRLRVVFKDPNAAADRFSSFAAMSALAYSGEDAHCQKESLKPATERPLLSLLEKKGWHPLTGPLAPRCEDDKGMFYRIWVHGKDDTKEKKITIAFRGTDGPEDWKANFRWFLRRGEDQYSRARMAARNIVRRLKKKYEGQVLTFFSTGHSLGGGLAQHVLYDQPKRFLQAIVFNSSPVTGKSDVPKEYRKEACKCRKGLKSEARIYRVYESGEILEFVAKGLRNAKTPTPLNRHLHEVAFDIETGNPFSQHAMEKLALGLKLLATDNGSRKFRWYQGKNDLKWYRGEDRCTVRFEQEQQDACAGVGLWKNDLWAHFFGSDCPS